MAATIGENSPAKYQPPGGMLRGYHDTNPPKSLPEPSWTALNCSKHVWISTYFNAIQIFKRNLCLQRAHLFWSEGIPLIPLIPLIRGPSRSHTLRAFHPSSWPKRWILCLPCWPQLTKSSNYTMELHIELLGHHIHHIHHDLQGIDMDQPLSFWKLLKTLFARCRDAMRCRMLLIKTCRIASADASEADS